MFARSDTEPALLNRIRPDTGTEHSPSYFDQMTMDKTRSNFVRRLKAADRLPRWSGEVLDLVVDFVTYVFIPAYAIAASGLLPDLLGPKRAPIGLKQVIQTVNADTIRALLPAVAAGGLVPRTLIVTAIGALGEAPVLLDFRLPGLTRPHPMPRRHPGPACTDRRASPGGHRM